MDGWVSSQIDFITPLDDGVGRWRVGLMADPGHPNTEGHRVMFKAIDMNIFQPYEQPVSSDPVYVDAELCEGPAFTSLAYKNKTLFTFKRLPSGSPPSGLVIFGWHRKSRDGRRNCGPHIICMVLV